MKHIMKKLISLTMVLILLLGAFAGCDGSCELDNFYKADDVMH